MLDLCSVRVSTCAMRVLYSGITHALRMLYPCVTDALHMSYLLYLCFTYAIPFFFLLYLCITFSCLTCALLLYLRGTYVVLMLYCCAQVRAAIEDQTECTCALLVHYLCFTDAFRYEELTKLGRLPSKLIAKPLNGAALRSRTTHLTCGERYFFFPALLHHRPHLRRAYFTAA